MTNERRSGGLAVCGCNAICYSLAAREKVAKWVCPTEISQDWKETVIGETTDNSLFQPLST